MTAGYWRGRYLAALEAATDRAAADAHAGPPWRLALGFTNSIDRIVTLDGNTLAALAGPDATSSRLPADRVQSPAELVQTLLHFVRTGQGGEIWIGDPAVGAWIVANFRGRTQVGGTGVRAANTLAGVGFSSILHVTNLPAEQASLIDGSGRVVIPTPGGLQTPDAAARPGDPPMVHYIFEFQAGMTVPLAAETIIAPRANRVIVSLDPVNLRQPIDPLYIDAVADPAHPIRWTLVSGFSQVANAAMCQARIAETVAAIARWRRKPVPPRVHLELGAMPSPRVLATVLDQLAPAVDSLGLNADELAAVLALRGMPAVTGIDETTAGLADLQRQLGLTRLSVHSQDYCLTVTQAEPAAEQTALLYGSLVAGTFARRADFSSTAELHHTLAHAAPSPTGLAVGQELARTGEWINGVARRGDGWLVFVPTLAMPQPATTIGLGDSFTAGVLAML